MNSNDRKCIGAADLDLELKCEYCGQQYWMDALKIAAFLYGIFLLDGNEGRCFGTTCPRCLKTIRKRCDKASFESIKRLLWRSTGLYDLSSEYYPYYSSTFEYFTKDNIGLKSFDILTWDEFEYFSVTEPLFNISPDKPHSWDENQVPAEEYLCSYVAGWTPPVGSLVYICWFREKEIDALVSLENERALKVFPRYVPKVLACEDIERFCWRYYLLNRYLGMEKAGEEADQNVVSDFINILLAHPACLGLLPWNKSSKHPFLNHEISETIEGFDPWSHADMELSPRETTSPPFFVRDIPDEFKSSQAEAVNPRTEMVVEETEHEKMVQEIRSHFSEPNIHRFAYGQYLSFIMDFISIARRNDFSYASAWQLREDYLGRLYDYMRKGLLEKSRYAFYGEGPTWTIIYDGRTIRGLKGKGFEFIYFLVCRKQKVFRTDELAYEVEKLPTDQVAPSALYSTGHDSRDEKKHKPKVDHKAMIYGDALEELKKHRNDLLAELREAEETNDPGLIHQATKSLDEFEEYVVQYLGKNGKTRAFQDESKRTKDRIAKSIERALKSIKKHDEDVWRHFKSALQPTNSFLQSYRPQTDISWQTK